MTVLDQEGPTSRLRGPISQIRGTETIEADPDLRILTATTLTDSRTRTPAPRRAGTPPPGQDVTETATSGAMIRPDR